MTTGTIGILNVGAGDTKLVFDKNNPMESARSARIVADMLKRGYVLFIETGKDAAGNPSYQRVLEFKEDVCEYIIADLAAPVEQEKPDHEQSAEATSGEGSEEGPGEWPRAAPARASIPKAGKGGRPRKAVDAGDTRGIAVARSAGG